MYFVDRIHRVPRLWSNSELKKVADLLSGRIINVSGWRDIDKEGKRYKEYFRNGSEYWVSNYITETYGYQGTLENEILLNLEMDLPNELNGRFDVVFNHTVLEHVYQVFKAFENLCKLSNDIVIIVVPFIQQQHTEYGDYWRFTPHTLKRLFEDNNMEMIYVNFNDDAKSSIYIFAVGSKHPEKWGAIKNIKTNILQKVIADKSYYIGTRVIKNSGLFKVRSYLGNLIEKYIR